MHSIWNFKRKKVIIWLEPEKHSLVSLLAPCIRLVYEGNSDVVVPRRRTFDNYPYYQQTSELIGNWRLGSITGRQDIDFFFGPRILSLDAAQIMADSDGHLPDKWEVLFVPFLTYFQKKLQVTSVTVDYKHPPEQTIEDSAGMRAKRDEQREILEVAMMNEAKRIHWDPSKWEWNLSHVETARG
jgi:hypothetical protein